MSQPKYNDDRQPDAARRLPAFFLAAGFAALVLCLASLLALLGPPASRTVVAGPRPQADAIVRCEPASVTAYTNEIVTMDLYIQDVDDLWGVDLQLSFTPGIAHVLDLNPGVDLAQFEPLDGFLATDIVLSNTADNTLGTIKYINSQLMWPPKDPASGSGSVARLQFEADQAGTLVLNWEVTDLSNPSGEDIPNTVIPCQITFQYPTAVELLTFTATSGPGHSITLHWKTASELNVLGYNVYRSESPVGEQQLLNPEPIPGTDFGGTMETSYTYRDTTTAPLTTYYYWLELVHMVGPDSVYGPEQATALSYHVYLPEVGR